MYLKTDNPDLFIEFDSTTRTVRVWSKTDIKSQIDTLRLSLDALPEPMTNAEKLAWFNANYPQSHDMDERLRIKALIDQLQAVLEALKAL